MTCTSTRFGASHDCLDASHVSQQVTIVDDLEKVTKKQLMSSRCVSASTRFLVHYVVSVLPCRADVCRIQFRVSSVPHYTFSILPYKRDKKTKQDDEDDETRFEWHHHHR